MKRIAIIGSTGSVGCNTLNVVDSLDGELQVVGLAANRSVGVLAGQAARYRPRTVVVADSSQVERFRMECATLGIDVPRILGGREGLRQVAAAPDVDLVVSAAVGAAGLEPTYAALQSGKRVALANKEAMVIAGELLRKTADKNGGVILPVDSEHNAIDQCLRAGRSQEVRRLILTASGGPFLNRPISEFGTVTPEEALRHPTWKMGPRITVDSATLMNKGFEIIEARWLFDIPSTSIDVVIHPQSIVHSMVEFVDGSIVAQLGAADMRGPIQYALTYPDRRASPVPSLDLTALPALEFQDPDHKKFPALSMAYRAIKLGGTAPAVLNAADEVAVEAFLQGRIAFSEVIEVIEAVLSTHAPGPVDTVERVLAADQWARNRVHEVLARRPAPRAP